MSAVAVVVAVRLLALAPPERALDWAAFFQRFSFIYPTDTAWDAELGEIVKISNMRLMFGKRAVEFWLDSPDRRTVDLKNVVFDPTGKADPAITINLFRGMAKPPASGGDCRKLIELLQFLCGEADQDQAPVTE